MSFYLQDSGSAFWQLGVTTDGREQNAVVGTQSIVALVLLDSTGVYWQAGITTAGRLTWTVVSPQALTSIVLRDVSGQNWAMSVSAAGRTLLASLLFQPVEEGYMPPIGGGYGSTVTVW